MVGVVPGEQPRRDFAAGVLVAGWRCWRLPFDGNVAEAGVVDLCLHRFAETGFHGSARCLTAENATWQGKSRSAIPVPVSDLLAAGARSGAAQARRHLDRARAVLGGDRRPAHCRELASGKAAMAAPCRRATILSSRGPGGGLRGAAALHLQHETGEIIGRVNAFLGFRRGRPHPHRPEAGCAAGARAEAACRVRSRRRKAAAMAEHGAADRGRGTARVAASGSARDDVGIAPSADARLAFS